MRWQWRGTQRPRARRWPPERLHQRYDLLPGTGSITGGWATVLCGWDRQRGQMVAIKRAHERAKCASLLRREARLLSQLELPAIPTFLEVFEEAGQSYLVEEWRPGAPLDEYPLPPGLVRHVGRVLTSTLAVLHAQGICHGDLSPGNVLLEGAVVSLVDFGLASTREQPLQARGTHGYASPEQWTQRQISIEGEVYSLAMVLGCALTLSSPQEVGRAGSFSALWDAYSPWEILPEVAETLTLLNRAIAADPHARPPLSALLEVFAGEEVVVL